MLALHVSAASSTLGVQARIQLSRNQTFLLLQRALLLNMAPMKCLQVVKSKLQTQNIFAPDRYTGMWDCARRLYRAEGWQALWRGFTPCFVRSIPANPIAFLTFEAVRSSLSAAP